MDWEKKKEEELERWSKHQVFLQQEFARELGIHQGRMSIIEEKIEEEIEKEPEEKPVNKTK